MGSIKNQYLGDVTQRKKHGPIELLLYSTSKSVMQDLELVLRRYGGVPGKHGRWRRNYIPPYRITIYDHQLMTMFFLSCGGEWRKPDSL